MQVCNYCGRNLRNHYDHCPGCNSTDFTFKPDEKTPYFVNTPPKDGYKINHSIYEETFAGGEMNGYTILGIMIACFLSIGIFMYAFTENGMIALGLFVGAVIITTPLFIIGHKKTSVARTEQNRKKKLSKEGILVKNIPFVQVPDTNTVQVDFIAPNGQRLVLNSDSRIDILKYALDGKVDVLLDSSDYSNYYIDVEIF